MYRIFELPTKVSLKMHIRPTSTFPSSKLLVYICIEHHLPVPAKKKKKKKNMHGVTLKQNAGHSVLLDSCDVFCAMAPEVAAAIRASRSPKEEIFITPLRGHVLV